MMAIRREVGSAVSENDWMSRESRKVKSPYEGGMRKG